MLKAFFKDSTIYMIPTILMYGTNFFLLPLYTRILSPADYGALDMLRVLESCVLLVVALEIVQGHGRYYMDEKNPAEKIKYASTAFIFTILCFSLFFIICNFFSLPLSRSLFGGEGFKDVFELGVAYITASGFLLFVSTQLRYELRSKEYAIVSIVTFLTTAMCSLLFAVLLDFKLRGMVGAIIIGNIVGLTTGLLILRNSFSLSFDIRKLKEMLVFSVPLVPSGVAVFLSGYVDRLMINEFLSLEEVGLYGMGFRIAAIVSLLMIGFNRALSPLIITHYREKETPNEIATIFRFFVCLSLIFFLGLTLFSKEILWLLTTPSYYEASKVVIFLVPAILFSQMYMFAPGTGIAKKTFYIMWINVVAAIMNIGLNWLLIPKLGFQGAALATFCSHISVFAIKMSVSQRYYFIPFNWKPIIFSMILVAFLSIPSQYLLLGELSHFMLKCALMLLLLFVCYWTKLISKQEILVAVNKGKSLFLYKN